MDINPIVLSIPIYFLLIGIELIIQQVSNKKIYRLNDAVTNISCGITQQLTGIFLKVVGVGVYYLVYEYLAIFEIPSNWLTFIILFFAVDFCYYWAHRMSHEINLFWGGHVVHHQSEDYNFSVALRQGSFQILWTFAFNLPLAVIGFDPVNFVLVSALVTVYQFWIHTETIGKMGFIEKFMNTPSHHRVHHGRDPKYIDKNHAGVFIIWDKMFGTFQEEEERPTYGITKPINSWNPVWVNLDHYVWMWGYLKKIPKWKDRLKFMFYKPGWFPEYMGGYQAAPEVDKTRYKKFDTLSPTPLNLYVLFQYLLALGATAFFLFQQANFATWEKVAFVTAIILTIMNCGALFEMKNWVWLLEKVRILGLSAGVITISYYLNLNFWFIIVSIAYFVVSMSWMILLNFSVNKNQSLVTVEES
ncbi:sterol desaturase family protein [Fulvivirga kasyanovii]|uniref:Sterol desaturase family protein n=1 Tax=Fulvivirga kasyanovii TaxID=396812 RepID=A0ABW9RTC0_9BACT|nr:sterol desaturase family protein [Fulvivirga kasyanovii]MTI26539.1 sterol desaturase family protein [Fulvivirga kasyanovii]